MFCPKKYARLSAMKQFILLTLVFISQSIYAVEVAPRITDREIIELLAEIKAEIKADKKIANQRFESINQRFDDQKQEFNQHFDDQKQELNQRFDNQKQEFNQRFESINQRFESINQRFEQVDKRMAEQTQSMNQQFNQIWTLMMVMLAGIFGLIGFIIWDRTTALKPIEKKIRRMEEIEQAIEKDLEIRHENGSLLTRLVKSLQELAKTDPKVAGVLRSFSLL